MLAFVPLGLICPLGCLLLVLLTFDVKERPIEGALLIGLCCAMAFYGLRLGLANDISRHIALLMNYARVDFVHCFGAGHYRSLFVWDIWCWIIGKTGDVYLLQSSAAFIGYSLVSYVIFDAASELDVSKRSVVFVFLTTFVAIPFLQVVDGIRSASALLICAYAAYGHFCKRRNYAKTIILFIMAALIHQVAIVPVVCVLITPFVAKSPRAGFILVFVLCVGSASAAAFILPFIDGVGNDVARFFSDAIKAFLGYHEGNAWTAEHSRSLNTRVNVIFSFLWIAYLLLNVYVLRKRRGWVDDGFHYIDVLTVVLALATIAFSFVLEVNSLRLLPILCLLGSVSVMVRMADYPTRESKRLFVLDCIAALIAIGLFLLHVYSILYGILEPKEFVETILLGAIGVLI